MEVHFDVFPTPGEVETGAGIIVEFKIGHATDEAGGFFGVFLDFFEGVLIFNAVVEFFAEADSMTDISPVVGTKAV